MSSNDEEDVTNKLVVYTNQLNQVNALLEADPANEQFLQLKADIEKLIVLTYELLKNDNENNSSNKDAPAATAQTNSGDTKGEQTYNPEDAGSDDEDDEDELDGAFRRKEVPSSSSSSSSSSTSAAPAYAYNLTAADPIQPGDSIAVVSGSEGSGGAGSRAYAGVVTELLPDGESCRVRYYEFENAEVTLPVGRLMHLCAINQQQQQQAAVAAATAAAVAANSLPGVAPPAPSQVPESMALLQPSDVMVGKKYRCKYSADQTYYTAVINSRVPNAVSGGRGVAFQVTFEGYNNSEVVPLEYITWPVGGGTGSTAAASGAAGSGASNANGGGSAPTDKVGNKGLLNQAEKLIKIPENLKIQPGDTEEDKLRKKKKIKAIKSKNRIIEKAQVQTASQHSWQKFVKKSEKKHLAGTSALVNNSHHSGGASGAFAPSSSGGGKPMTVFQERTKHSKYGGAAGGMGSLGDDDDDDDA